MRKLKLLLLPLLVLVACKSEPSQRLVLLPTDWKAIAFEPYVRQKSVPLFPEKEGKGPQMHIALTLLHIAGNGSLQKCVDDVVYGGTGNQYIADTFASYEEQYDTVADWWFKGPPSETMNWRYNEVMEGSLMVPLVLISRSRDYYTGGAHGQQEKQYFVISMEETVAKQLVLSDLIKDEAQPLLKDTVMAFLRRDADIGVDAPLTEADFFKDTLEELPSNFFITKRELGFHWDPYEIAPYSKGAIEVLIPYISIKSMFTEWGAQIMDAVRNYKDIE
jgi:hypothetical protein